MANIRTKKDLLDYLTERAKEYRKEAKESLSRNGHMFNLSVSEVEKVDPNVIDAILVDFINCIGYHQGLDWGLYASHFGDHVGKWAVCGVSMQWWHYGKVTNETERSLTVFSHNGRSELWDKKNPTTHIVYVDTEEEAREIYDRDEMLEDYKKHKVKG